MTNTLAERARRYATKAHAAIDQRRKYTNDPYIVHPQAVMELVRSVPHTEEMLAAAWLHDTVEDTPTTLGDIESHFGPQVAELVRMLTNVSHAEEFNRLQTLDNGMRRIEEYAATQGAAAGRAIDGGFLFTLYDTYGFPRDLAEAGGRQGLELIAIPSDHVDSPARLVGDHAWSLPSGDQADWTWTAFGVPRRSSVRCTVTAGTRDVDARLHGRTRRAIAGFAESSAGREQ